MNILRIKKSSEFIDILQISDVHNSYLSYAVKSK